MEAWSDCRPTPYLSTFSIVACCPHTGELGIAVSTCEICVGWVVPFVQARVGAIASQARSNPYFGIDGLKLLAQGLSADEALQRMLGGDRDIDREQRQVALVDAKGGSAAYTGPHCRGWAGHLLGDGVVVAGNLLTGGLTVEAMMESFQKSAGQALGDRLVLALESGQEAGGDVRGRLSAAVRVCKEGTWPWIDVRVDSHPDPVAELRRIFEEFKAHHLGSVEMITPPVVYPLAREEGVYRQTAQ
jgi:uncharacterized Ntn-hydrolase superfamily protein